MIILMTANSKTMPNTYKLIAIVAYALLLCHHHNTASPGRCLWASYVTAASLALSPSSCPGTCADDGVHVVIQEWRWCKSTTCCVVPPAGAFAYHPHCACVAPAAPVAGAAPPARQAGPRGIQGHPAALPSRQTPVPPARVVQDQAVCRAHAYRLGHKQRRFRLQCKRQGIARPGIERTAAPVGQLEHDSGVKRGADQPRHEHTLHRGARRLKACATRVVQGFMRTCSVRIHVSVVVGRRKSMPLE